VSIGHIVPTIIYWNIETQNPFKISKLWRIFIYFLNQRFGGHLARYLALMETKPKKLNKSLWNEDGLPKYSLWLVMPNLGLWDLTTIIRNQVHHPKGSNWVGLGLNLASNLVKLTTYFARYTIYPQVT
jgi:hypothetical protein